MFFITIKEHKQRMGNLRDENADLRRKLEYSMSLKEILMGVQEWQDAHNLTIRAGNGLGVLFDGSGSHSINLSDDIPQYVPDLLDGGKVIRQEGTRAIQITKDGQVNVGLTKQAPDKGRSYKLIQQ